MKNVLQAEGCSRKMQRQATAGNLIRRWVAARGGGGRRRAAGGGGGSGQIIDEPGGGGVIGTTMCQPRSIRLAATTRLPWLQPHYVRR